MTPYPVRFGVLCCLVFCLVGAPAHADDASDLAALRAAVAQQAQRASAPAFERSDVLVRATVLDPLLSPDGSAIAWLRDEGRSTSVWTLATADGEPRRVLPGTDATQLAWSHDGRWLLLRSARQLFALAMAGQAGSGIVTTLGGSTQREMLDVDPVQPAAVLVRERLRATPDAPQRWRLLRIDMRGQRTTLHEDVRRIIDVALHADGTLAFLQRSADDHLEILRANPDGSLGDAVRCERMHRCGFLPVTNAAGELLLRGDLGGDLSGVQRLDASGKATYLHRDPRTEADLDGLSLDPVTAQPLIASYRSVIAANHGLTADTSRHVAAIERQLPQRNLRIDVGTAAWLVSERDSTLQSPRWHLYDPQSGTLRRVLDKAPLAARNDAPAAWLPEASFARKIPFVWRASDGMRLHGFLSLPPGADPARVPLLANVHGGPSSHVRPDFSTTTQLLVNRGYAVFEPNFRGSTGLGRNYMLTAAGDFGNGRVQRDIVDGVRFLLAHGIGDAERVGIVGASFGGYSALLGVTFSPELFKVGVAAVPPSDFGWNLHWVARSREALVLSGYLDFEAWMRLLSLDIADAATMARLGTQSPLSNAAAMQRPLLLFAGGEDRRVALRGVVEYAATLKQQGKHVSLFVDPDAGHGIDDPVAREAYLYVVEQMLHAHLGGAAPTPPDRAVRTALARSARFVAPEFAASTAPPP